MIRNASRVLTGLLEGGHSTIAGRLAGARCNIGRPRFAEYIIKGMEAAGYTVHETAPFADKLSITIPARELSPYVNRLRLVTSSETAHP